MTALRIEAYAVYAEAKYDEMLKELSARQDKLQKARETLDNPNPFQQHAFTVQLRQTLESQERTVQEYTAALHSKRYAVTNSIDKERTQFKEILYFRDVMLAAELASDTEIFLAEIQHKISVIDSELQQHAKAIGADESNMKVLMESLGDVKELYVTA